MRLCVPSLRKTRLAACRLSWRCATNLMREAISMHSVRLAACRLSWRCATSVSIVKSLP